MARSRSRSRKGSRKGNSQLIGKMKKGDLTKYGYHLTNSVRSRHIALNKALNHYDNDLSVYRKLNAIAVLQKNTHPALSKIARADANWILFAYHKKLIILKNKSPNQLK